MVIRRLAVLLLTCGVLAAAWPARVLADDKDTIRQARQASYSLQREGFGGFQCGVTPNWDLLLADQRKADPASADAAVKKLRQIRFTLLMDRDGKTTIKHTEVPAENQQVADALKQIYGGMEEMLTGFFQTWNTFMLTSPFPAPEDTYQLQDLGSAYRLSYKDGDADVLTNMSKDFVIGDLKVTTREFTSSIRPQYAKNPKGLILTGYDADYQSSKPEERTVLKVAVGYQPVVGFQLPRTLKLSGSYGGDAFGIEVAFADCSATKR